jgi:energy-coupling factor transporter transmembrane protein EcfT
LPLSESRHRNNMNIFAAIISILINAFSFLIVVIPLLAITAFPFFAAMRVGAFLGLRYKAQWLKVVLPLGFMVIFAIWLVSCYEAFRSECKRAPQIQSAAKGSLSPLPSMICDRFSNTMGGACAITTNSFSSHVLMQMPAKNTKYRWALPPKQLEMRVVERATGLVTASVTDVVFGEGLIGLYLRLLGRDQDFEILSCGYASSDIGPWRPTLTSRPRFTQYKDADFALELIKSVP